MLAIFATRSENEAFSSTPSPIIIFPATRQRQSNNSGASGKAKVSPRWMRRGRLIASRPYSPHDIHRSCTNAEFPTGVLSYIQRANGVSRGLDPPVWPGMALRGQVRWIPCHRREIERQTGPIFQTAKFLQ